MLYLTIYLKKLSKGYQLLMEAYVYLNLLMTE